MTAPLFDHDHQTTRRPPFAQLTAENLSFSYADHPAVDRISFTLAPGERVAIVGPNGCGKSTLLRLLLGSLTPSAGHVTLDGKSPATLGRIQMARRVALVPQPAGGGGEGQGGGSDMGSGHFTVREIVLMSRYAHHADAGGILGSVALGFETPEDLRLADLAMWNSDVHHLAERELDTLSGGERQRVAIARAFTQNTPVLLLDEPTSALDLHHQFELLAQLAELSTAPAPPRLIVMVTHDLNLAARFATRILLMDRAKLIANGPPQTVLTPHHIASVYRVSVSQHNDGTLSFARLPPASAPVPRRSS